MEKRRWLNDVELNKKEIKIVAAAMKMAMVEGFYTAPDYVSEDDINDLLDKLSLPREIEKVEWDEWED